MTTVNQPRVREATYADLETLLAWRNDFNSRKHFRDPEPVDMDQHRRWLHDVLINPQQLLLIFEDSLARRVAAIRFDISTTQERIEAEVSVTVDPDLQGKGWGFLALRASEEYLCKHSSVASISAFVFQDNARSIQLFSKAGYAMTNGNDDQGVWLKKDMTASSSCEVK